jgi:S-layer protein
MDAANSDIIRFAATATNGVNGDITSTAVTKVTAGGAASFGDYLDIAASGDATNAPAVKYFEYLGDTYIVIDKEDGETSDGSTFVGGTDAVVKLVGLYPSLSATFTATDSTEIVNITLSGI